MDALPLDPSAISTPLRRPWYHWRRIGFNFLTLSILAHLILSTGATYLVVQTIQTKRRQTFSGAPAAPNRSIHAMEHKVQMQKKQQTMSAPAPVRRITTSAVNTRIALPQVPSVPSLNSSNLVPLAMAGAGGMGVGLSMGHGGAGGGNGGGGGISLFGLRTKGSSSLIGTFYDFKQTPDGQPTSMAVKGTMLSEPEQPANDEDMKLVGRFANGGFDEDMFSQYFKGPAPLYATQIFIPVIPSKDGPKEFNLADKVEGRRWVVVYRGKVAPAESGRYHFVGVADDYLIVRFRHNIVLDGSLFHPTGKKPLKEYFTEGLTGSLRCAVGDSFNVDPGDYNDLEILIGEQPGGESEFFLMLEKEGTTYAKDSKGNPILPIFKLAPGDSDRTGRGAPVTAADTSWSVWKAEKP